MMTVVVPGNEANAVHFLAHYFLRTCFMLVLLPLLLADTNFCWGDRITFIWSGIYAFTILFVLHSPPVDTKLKDLK